MLTVASVVVVGWLLAATIGTWAYFAGDQGAGRNSAGRNSTGRNSAGRNAANVPQF